MNWSLEKMRRYQERKRQLQRLKMDDPVCKSEAIERMAYGATTEAWGAFIWHCMYGEKRAVNKRYRNGND